MILFFKKLFFKLDSATTAKSSEETVSIVALGVSESLKKLGRGKGGGL